MNPTLVRGHLVENGLSGRDAHLLLNPGDHQNVPCAMKLLSAVSDLPLIPIVDQRPTFHKQRRALFLLGRLFQWFTNPFTNPQMTLSQQLTFLASHAFLLFALYTKNRTSFLPGQLYHDTQATIKSLYFNVAKQIILDPNASFYLCQLGDDRLEVLFGRTRTVDHSRNVDALEIANKMASAMSIDHIMSSWPEWDCGSQCLKLGGALGVDHVNPKSWSGDTCV